MRIAYLIMTHENPQLLQKSIRTLSFGDTECAFFIHLDRKTRFEPFASLSGQNIQFIEPRIPVYWGEFSQVEATLSLVRHAIEDPLGYDYFALLTGSCYPLRTGGYIRKFLEANKDLEYMDIIKVPGPGKPMARFDTIRYPSSKPVRRLAFRALATIGLAWRDHRKYLGHLEPYAGEGTWALTRDACRYLLDVVSANLHLETYFRNTFASDEAFFHTILGNSKFLTRMRRNLVYAVWLGPGPANGHPAVINHEHVAVFDAHDPVTRNDIHGSGELLFARKFSDGRLDVVQRVDLMIERKECVRLSNANNPLGTTVKDNFLKTREQASSSHTSSGTSPRGND
jgi:hypothetical protein